MSRKNWTSEKIFSRLLNNKTKKTYWDNIYELRRRPNDEVFHRAHKLAKSDIDKEIIIGIDILQQLGFEPRFKQNQMINIHFKLLENSQPNDVLKSIFYGIGHNNDKLLENQISKLIEFKDQKNIEVKHALISALSGIENLKAIQTLIDFTKDKTASIRNWATFGIGSLVEFENIELIKALWDRVNDNDQETRYEAITGLANRNDKRVKDIIIRELKNEDYGTLLFEAILILRDKEFLPFLENNLKVARSETDINNGWVMALEETIEELKTTKAQQNT